MTEEQGLDFSLSPSRVSRVKMVSVDPPDYLTSSTNQWRPALICNSWGRMNKLVRVEQLHRAEERRLELNGSPSWPTHPTSCAVAWCSSSSLITLRLIYTWGATANCLAAHLCQQSSDCAMILVQIPPISGGTQPAELYCPALTA